MGYTDFIGGKGSVAKVSKYNLYWEEYDNVSS